ncbi:MAG TPA: serine hydrolase [Steroidobacteraceae bacterium]
MLNRHRDWLTALLRGVVASALIIASIADAAPPADLDAYAQRVLEAFETPGMAIAIVERGQPTVLRSYGVRRMGQPARVDENTLFAIGSTSKAFTSAVLATMVDEGKLAWDTKVSDVLPGFKLQDAYASSEMTVRDLLVHRSGLGLGAGDLLFYPQSDRTRAEIVHSLRYIKPASSFRSTFAYSNIMYVVAGEVIQAVGGASWEDAVRRRIFDPLQMKSTTTSSVLPAGANRAWPHSRVTTDMRGDGPVVALAAPANIDIVGPAGSIQSSTAEIARWLELQLGHGLDPRTNARVISEAQALEMWKPQTVVPVAKNPPGLELAQASYKAYGLGWLVSDYRGTQIIAHSGGVPGMVVLLVIVPAKDVAFAIFLNSEESSALSAMQYHLLDHFLGLASPDWTTALVAARQARVASGREALAAAAAEQKKLAASGTRGPSLPLDGYAGRYRDAWYGDAVIERTKDGLRLRLEHTPALAGPLEHVRFDTFIARWADRSLEDAYVTFALDAKGAVERMTLRAVSPLADFSFDYQDLAFTPVR